MSFNEKQLSIIETAENLFAEKGFDGTSVRDIAKKAGVNVAMISYYFGSKEKLFQALFSYRAEGTTLKLESMLIDKVLVPIEKINMMIDYYIDKFLQHQSFHKIIMREQVTNYKSATSNYIYLFKKKNLDLVKQLIKEGQKTGHFNKNIDISLLMATLVGSVSNMIITQHFYKEIINQQTMPKEQFQKLIKKKLSNHLKFIFKAIITDEI